MKTGKGKVEADGTVKRDLAISAFGYKSHIGIDRRHGFIRRQKVTDGAAHDGARLREGLIDPTNTASDVWGDTAYQSTANADWTARPCSDVIRPPSTFRICRGRFALPRSGFGILLVLAA